MPTLKDLECHVQWADTGSPFPEYGTQYGDGVVETYIAIPTHPQSFTIRLTSRKFIFEGLAMIVFIDGKYQCNRNRVNLLPHKKGLPRNRTEIDFLVRQKEKALGDGTYMGREWRFDDFNIVPQLPPGVKESHFEELGTIEVMVLRCRTESIELQNSTTSSGEDSDVMGDGRGDGAEMQGTTAVASENNSPDGERTQEVGDAGDPFAGLFQVDGASDFPPYQHGFQADGPAYSPYYSDARDARRAPYSPQRAPAPPFPPSYHPRASLNDLPYRPPPQYRPSPAPATHTQPPFGPPRLGRRVHFDYGDSAQPYYSSQWRHGDQHQPYSHGRWEGADADGRIPGAGEYHPPSQHRDTNPYADYPGPPQDRHGMYHADQQAYGDNPNYHQDHSRHPSWSPRAGFPVPPPPSHVQPAVDSTGTSAPYLPPQPFQTFPSHQPPHQFQAAPFHQPPPAVAWPPGQTQPVQQAIPIWMPPTNIPGQPPIPNVVPFYPAPGNVPWFHQGPGLVTSQASQNAPIIGAPSGPPSGSGSGQQNSAPTTQPGQRQGSFDPAKEQNNPTNNAQGNGTQEANHSTADPWANNTTGGDANGQNTSGNADWSTNDNNTNNAGDSGNTWDKPNDDAGGSGNGWDQTNNDDNNGNSNDATNDTAWDQNDQNQNTNWDQSGDAQNTSGWDNGGQNNNTTNEQPNAEWGNAPNNDSNNNNTSIAPVVQTGQRALYGPYGAYYASRALAESSVPHDAEEEPRYDVPQALAQSTGTSKQVQPGKGYLYNKKRCVPYYVDDLDAPYARFVFKYRTQAQIKDEIGVDIGIEPTPNEEANALENLDKAELIQLVLRAKNALGGTIPTTPANEATPASANSFDPVPVDPPEHGFLKYSLPPARSASNTKGLGISFNGSGPQDAAAGGNAQEGQAWDSSAGNNWQTGGGEQQWAGGNNHNNQEWNNQSAGGNNNGGGWDGQQENANTSAADAANESSHGGWDKPASNQSQGQNDKTQQGSRRGSSKSQGFGGKKGEPANNDSRRSSAISPNGGTWVASSGATSNPVQASSGSQAWDTSAAPQASTGPLAWDSFAFSQPPGSIPGSFPPPAPPPSAPAINFIGEGVIGGGGGGVVGAGGLGVDETAGFSGAGPRPPTPTPSMVRVYSPPYVEDEPTFGRPENPPCPQWQTQPQPPPQPQTGGWGNNTEQPAAPGGGW